MEARDVHQERERTAAEPVVAAADESAWPFVAGRRTVFLLDAYNGTERRLLEQWTLRNRPEGMSPSACDVVAIPPSRRHGRGRLDPKLEANLATDDDPLLAPLRVAWLPGEVDGRRSVRLRHLLTFGDPRDPGWLRQRWTLRSHPDRVRIVVAEPAPASELRRRWRQAGGADSTLGLPEFVARQAHLALERAERRLRGARYKVPRFVHEEILRRPAFRGGLAKLARELGRPESSVAKEAHAYLREIAATHSPYFIDLAARLIHLLYTRGYGERLRYDQGELSKVYELAQRHPVIFLPTHKSNLDHLVLQYALYENGHPPNHTAGGINMSFFPVGAIVRRCGVFFIRRTFKDLPVYKFVLRQYVDYLIEKRFPLEWYIEGGRSRSGKLLPPRLGLLAYVVDAYRRGKSDDVCLIPVSIAYDQIQDVGDYVAENRGAAKQREGLGWFLKLVSGLQSRFGDVHIRFGEPLSLAQALEPAGEAVEGDPDEQNLAVQKIAFEVSVRINRATPITPTSLATLALLGAGDRALTVEDTFVVLRNWMNYVRRRKLPTTEELVLDAPEGVKAALDTLVESGVVSCYAEGPEPVYAIGPEQHLTAAYYRNTIIHFFLNTAIAELALLRAAEEHVTDRADEFWAEALRLRDLLKFEFFFAEKEEFREELQSELALHDPEWERRLEGDGEEVRALVRRIRPFTAHRVLRPFLEGYRVVADALERREAGKPLDEGAFLKDCLALGKQYQLQRRIHSPESVSKTLFTSGLRLAGNRELLAADGAELGERRRAFAAELREVIRRIDAIAALAESRRAGLID